MNLKGWVKSDGTVRVASAPSDLGDALLWKAAQCSRIWEQLEKAHAAVRRAHVLLSIVATSEEDAAVSGVLAEIDAALLRDRRPLEGLSEHFDRQANHLRRRWAEVA